MIRIYSSSPGGIPTDVKVRAAVDENSISTVALCALPETVTCFLVAVARLSPIEFGAASPA